ncbi:hypothetical protein CLU92_5361 [Janthinobacterium sp. 61]|nr:hypothetical protein CLU92_5361 [Janthinobacterium sp. 61]
MNKENNPTTSPYSLSEKKKHIEKIWEKILNSEASKNFLDEQIKKAETILNLKTK